MKVEIIANDFCPDNCPYFELEEMVGFKMDEYEIERYCANREICKYARDLNWDEEEFFKIDTGIAIDECVIANGHITGKGEILYYKTKDEYEKGEEQFAEPYCFDYNIKNKSISISGTEYAHDIDTEDLKNNIRLNVAYIWNNTNYDMGTIKERIYINE